MIEKIFKAYDIRGKFPEEINEEIAFRIGQAFVEFIRRKNPERKKIDILIGQDNRLSSSCLFKALSGGIINSGANVFSLGVCSTPMFYFGSKFCRPDDGGIMITASHLPKEYNGFKLVKEMPIPVDFETGLMSIKKLLTNKFKTAERKGIIVKKNVLKEYLKFNLKDVNLTKIKPFKIIIDTGNGVVGFLIPKIFKKSRCQIFHLFARSDGCFPNREPDFNKKGALKKVREEILKRRADLGVVFDGDGDRIGFLDNQGKLISPNFIIALMSEILLREIPGEKVLYTARAGRIVPETIKKNGGKPIISKIGHSIIKRKMKKENIFFGAESSGHYYLRDYCFSEAPFFVLFKLLTEMSQQKKTISQLIKPFKKFVYFSLNIKTKKSEEKILKLKKHFSNGKISEIDGLRIDFSDWALYVRGSKTEENILRLEVEAKNYASLREKIREIKQTFDF